MTKGLAYEIEVAKAIEAELAHGNLGLDPAQANVRHKPSYFSRDRKKDIAFDVSVEVRRKSAPEPYWVWVWENYNHSVPVDDAEEFHAKLDQVGADRTKGTIITPIGFDQGTIEYARSKGIGLWRYIPEGSLVCLMEDARGVADRDILRALTVADTTAFRVYGDFYGLACNGQLTTDRGELIRAELQDALAWYRNPNVKLEATAETGPRSSTVAEPMGISFNLPNPGAVKYLDERFDECIGEEFEEFRRESVKTIVVDGVRTGKSYAAVARRVVAAYPEIPRRKERSEFRKRVTVFVLTATGNAYCEANLQQVLNLHGARTKMEKSWVGPEDDRACSGCRLNFAQGWIPVEARFATGHRRPLAHSGCRCCLTFRRRPG